MRNVKWIGAIAVLCLVVVLILLPDGEVHYGLLAIEEDAIFTSSPVHPCPPGMYYEGTYNRAYFGYYSQEHKVKVRYFDEDTKVLSDPVEVWTSWGHSSSWSTPLLGDDHASPAVIVLQHQTGGNAVHNGKILAAAAEHGSPVENKGRLETRRSTYPEFSDDGVPDTSFEAAVSVRTTAATYIVLWELNDGTVFLASRLNRVASKSRHTMYAWTSTDAGASWTAYNNGRPLFDAAEGVDDTYYAMAYPNHDNTGLHWIINRYIYDDNAYTDILYLFYDHSDGKWYHTAGETEFALGDDYTGMDLVYESKKEEGEGDLVYGWDIKDDGSGNPYLIYIVDERQEGEPSPGDVYRANYSGGSWNTELVLAEGSGRFWYVSGAVFDPLDVDTIYVTPADGEGNGALVAKTQLQKWQKDDTVAKAEDITSGTAGSNARPVAIWNAAANNSLRFMWCYITHYEGTPFTVWDSTIYSYPSES